MKAENIQQKIEHTQQGNHTYTRRMTLGAPIVLPEEVAAIRSELGRVVATGGGYDPIHPGHISCLRECKMLGDTLIVIVNGDWFLRQKKGKPFQDLTTRSLIVSAISHVDIVVPYETSQEMGVLGAVQVIRPDVYGKGGDRSGANIRDKETYEALGIDVATGLGEDKAWSSTWALDAWVEHAVTSRS